MKRKFKILVITEIKHINNVEENIKKLGIIKYLKEPSYNQVSKIIASYDVIFTNPNKSKVSIDKRLINKAKNLKIICTASTGTSHVDVNYAKKLNIKIICLKEERKIINKISSTSELAFALLLASKRNLFPSLISVKNYIWDYTNFIGRQLNYLTIGVVGYGRLGKLFVKYCSAFNCKIIVYDPNKLVKNKKIIQVNNIKKLIKVSDVISFHIHLTESNKNLINTKILNQMKKDVTLINTSRGEIINQNDLIKFIKKNKNSIYCADVISNEQEKKKNNNLLKFAKNNNNILITPHIGGMTKEAQEIAYNHAVYLLKEALIDF